MSDKRFPDVPGGYPVPPARAGGARASGRAGASSRRACRSRPPRGSSSSSRGLPPPTTCRTSGTWSPAWSRTSSPATAPCAAITWPARPGGTPMAWPSRSRSRSGSASPASSRSRPTASPSSTRPAWTSVHTYERQWRAMTERIGYWVDLDHAYFTYTNEYIESVWWALSELAGAACSTRATRSSPTAPAAAPPSRATRWRRTTRTRTIPRSGPSSTPGRAQSIPTTTEGESLGEPGTTSIWSPGPPPPGRRIANVGLAVHPDLIYKVVEHPGKPGELILLGEELGTAVPVVIERGGQAPADRPARGAGPRPLPRPRPRGAALRPAVHLLRAGRARPAWCSATT